MDLDLHDIQSNLLRGYRVGEAEPHHRYLWLSLGDAAGARRTLAALSHHVTSCKAWDEGTAFVLNVGLTWTGLSRVWPHHGDVALGCKSTDEDQAGAECSDPEHSVLVAPEFVEGMARRAEVLGDVDDSAPNQWEPPLASDEIDAIVTISGADEAAVEAGHTAALAALAEGARLRVEHRADALAGHPDGTEHFGFVDGIGQPYVAGSGLKSHPGEGTPEDRGWTPIAAGEFVLGYAGEAGSTADQVHPWLKNCSYLALRRLEERVAEFRTFVSRTAQTYEVDPDWVAARMIGRWRSGAPLMTTPDRDDTSLAADPQRNNDFHYTGDRQGLRCPFGAHIRRTNPRDDPSGPTLEQVRRHRIIRRATPYGPWLPEGQRDDVERGVMFGVVNAELRNQFEYVQLNWVNGAISSKALTLGADRDPVVGANDGSGKFLIPRRSGPVIGWELPRFVRVRGGAYFLVPSLSLIARLAEAHP